MYNKQSLDGDFVIRGIIKVEISANTYSTETLIIPHITKTEFNNCCIIHFKGKIHEANTRSLYVWSSLEYCFVSLVLMDTAGYKFTYRMLTPQIT